METFLHADNQPVVEATEIRRQLKKILRSTAFRNAPGLKKFLEYVVGKSTEGLSSEIKEYSIAVEVLGKPNDYDPRLDTTVRVQAHRLREKLEEYYNVEGSSDEIVIELPKGHYIPQFSRRLKPAGADGESATLSLTQHPKLETDPALAAPPLQAAQTRLAADVRGQRNHRIPLSAWLGRVVLAILLLIAGALLSPWIHHIPLPGVSSSAHKTSIKPGGIDGPLQAIWAHFWNNSRSAIVAYSNSIFLVTETSDLLRLKAGDVDGLGAPAKGGEALSLAENPKLVEDAGPVFFNDGYTGTGEVMAVYYLDRLFARSNLDLSVERSQLVTTDDLRTQNVIFLGSIIENPVLLGLPLNQNFVFTQPQKAPTLWRARIVNLHPQPGEAASYGVERDSKTQVLLADYALVSFLPGVAPGREIAILAGLTTIGTQAAAQFITSPSGATDLMAHLDQSGQIDKPGSGKTATSHPSAKTFPRYFQALLRVEIHKDEILKIQYVAGRVLHRPGQGF
ncbi:MAG TPA: hypothetical protein VGX94_09915 [Terriglobia bacterium]|nr:hypothetical protein [Terriglobia bacterium]